MTSFIVRPFGTRNGIDFEWVDRELISAALDRLQITGRTTQVIAEAGNIRADMFHLLLTADLVIADISIHNANVFYELGVRHALRDKWTFLLRASIDEVPFDLKTDRYLSYDPSNPAATLDALIKGLAATRQSSKKDSPVYSLVPGLQAPNPSQFIIVPRDFQEEVRRADERGEMGDLRFLASELSGLGWRREGLRIIGEAQFRLRDLKYAAETWEGVRTELPDDVQANLRLGTIYQKMDDLVLSDEALKRVTNVNLLESENLAEARALLGSNAKTRWITDWQKQDAEARQTEALRSPFLLTAFNEYRKGFEADPRHYYSGLNALAIVTVLIELANVQPSVWQERFTDEDEATFRLKEYRTLQNQLSGAVSFALLACKQRLEREEKADPWLLASLADCAFLTGKSNAQQAYREALTVLGPFALESVRRQFEIFNALALLKKSIEAVASVLGTPPVSVAAAKQAKVLLFTGHRIDEPSRATPRFPADQEQTARTAIRQAIERELPNDGSPVIGLAGGASGGDLLFLEVCEELRIERRLYLIIPRDEYVRESVASAGPAWIERFNHQQETAQCREYQRSRDLPVWLQPKTDYGIWQRANMWMLYNALALGGIRTVLIALWDGGGGDGPGGTQHMVHSAQNRGARTIILDTHQMFGV